jgi:integrase
MTTPNLPPRKWKTPKGGRPRNQHGWLTPVKGGRWKLHWYVYTKLGETGHEERRHRSVTIQRKTTKTQAEAELAKIVARECGAPGNQTLLGDSTATFGWFWTKVFLPLRDGTWSTKQRQNITSLYRLHLEPRWGTSQLADMNAAELAEWLNAFAKQYGRRTVQLCHVYLKASLEEAVEEDLLRKNPMRRVRLPEMNGVGPHRPVLTIPQLRAVRSSLVKLGRQRDVVMFDVLAMTGMRPSEMLALRWQDFDGAQLFIENAFVGTELKRTKTRGSKAWVAIPAKLAAEIAKYRKSGAASEVWMFPADSGKPMSLDNWRKRVLKPAAADSGVAMDLRILRRTWATLAHDLGASLKAVQEQLRHSSITTTGDVYAQSISSSTKKAVEAVGKKYFQ